MASISSGNAGATSYSSIVSRCGVRLAWGVFVASKKISIVTPSYNQAAYLEETIQSVLSQDYANLEYIIVDGGSTDGSVDVIRKYEAKLAYWISEPDDGQAAAINKGFARATGDILAWINSDDKYSSGAITKAMKLFSDDDQLQLLYGDYFCFTNDGRLIAKPKIAFDFKIALYVYLMIPQPSSFWTKSLYDKLGGLNESFHFAFDYDFFLRAGRLLKNTPGSIRHEQDYFSYFRLHGESKTSRQQEKFKQERQKIRAQFDYLGRPRMLKRAVKTFYWIKTLYAFYEQRGFVPLKSEATKLADEIV